MKKILFLLTFFSFCSLHSQFTNAFQNPKTPIVQNFERYTYIPISEYSGRLNIDIPLFEVESGDISFLINIGYNSNGIRVDEESSEVGLGWFFNTGMISQVIQGKDDLNYNHEFKIPDYFSTPYAQYAVKPFPDWYLEYHYTNPEKAINHLDPSRVLLEASNPDIDKYSMVKVRSDGSFGVGHIQFPFNGNLDYFDTKDLTTENPTLGKDTERDLFTASFFGHNITFYATNSGSSSPFVFRVLNNEDYKINLIKNDVNEAKREHKWEIITPNGITYVFNEELISSTQSSTAIESSSYEQKNTYDTGVETATKLPSFNISPYTKYSRLWKISSIRDEKGNQILFNYEPLQNLKSTTSLSGSTDFLNIDEFWPFTDFGPGYRDGPIVESPKSNYGKGIYVKKTNSLIIQERSILKEINYSNNKIIFNNTSRLDIPGAKKISGLSVLNNGNIINNISLNYSYFNPNHINSSQKRLKLDSLSVNEKKYSFVYNGVTLPDKNSNSFDYWGFYNGFSNSTFINNPFRLFEDVNHIPDLVKSLAINIDGKANRSAHPVYSQLGILTKIKYPTGGTSEFKYELNEFDNIYFPNYDNKIGFNGTNYEVDYRQNSSYGYGLRISKVFSYDHNYNLVSEINYNYSMGKHIIPFSEFNYDNYYEVKFYHDIAGGASRVNKKVVSGPRLKSDFNSNYQTNYLGSSVGIGYDWVEKVEKGIATSNGKIRSYYTNVPDKTPKETFGVGGTGSSADNKLFGYSVKASEINNGTLTKKFFFNNFNDTVSKVTYDYESIVYSPVYQKGNLSTYNYNVKVVSKDLSGYVTVSDQGNTKLNTNRDYVFFYYPLKQTKVNLKSKTVLDYFPTGNLSSSTFYFYDDSYRQTKRYELFGDEEYVDRKEVKTEYRIKKPSIFNKDNILLPSKITKSIGSDVINVKEYNYEKPSGSYVRLYQQSDCAKINVINGEVNYDDCSVTKFNIYDLRGNILEYENVNGLFTTVLYGYNMSLPVAIVKNASLDEVASSIGITSSLLIENGLNNLSLLNNIRGELSKAQITTYTHKPLVGVTSIADPKGYTVYYEYDEFNRLQYVKDATGKLVSESKYHYKND